MMRTSKNLKIHEFIGLRCKVVESSCLDRVGLEGEVVDESKNLIVLDVNGKFKKIPKRNTIFLFYLENGEKVLINGNEILFRPEERPKKIL